MVWGKSNTTARTKQWKCCSIPCRQILTVLKGHIECVDMIRWLIQLMWINREWGWCCMWKEQRLAGNLDFFTQDWRISGGGLEAWDAGILTAQKCHNQELFITQKVLNFYIPSGIIINWVEKPKLFLWRTSRCFRIQRNVVWSKNTRLSHGIWFLV